MQLLNLRQAAALAAQVDIANLTITNIYFYSFLNRSIHNLAEDVKLQAEGSEALSLDILRSAQTLPAVLVDFKIRTSGPSVVPPSISAINNQLALFDLPPATLHTKVPCPIMLHHSPIITPLPKFVTRCYQEMWREYHDPQTPPPTMVKIGVQLRCTQQAFTQTLQKSFKKSVAETAGLFNEKTCSPSPAIYRIDLTVTETPTALPFGVQGPHQEAAISIMCSIRVPQDANSTQKAENIRDMLTNSSLIARLNANGVRAIEQVFQEAVVVWPSNLTDIGAAAASLTCFCNIGSTGPDGGTCTECVAGKYKGETGSSWCSYCESGKYSEEVGSSNSSSCTTCPTNSSSAAGSPNLSSCVCNIGFWGSDGGMCTLCEAGQYKEVAGADPCIDCPAGKYLETSGTFSSECIACPSGKVADNGSTSPSFCDVFVPADSSHYGRSSEKSSYLNYLKNLPSLQC
jgi:hypothetical protein